MKALLIDQIAKVNYKYTFPLANGLIKAGADVTLVIDQKRERENCESEIINLFNTDEKNIGKLRKILNYIYSYRTIDRILKKEKYNVLHTEWYTFSPVDYYYIKRFKKKYDIKYVATVHDILPFNQKFYDLNYHEKLYKLADSIILQAAGNMSRFKTLFPESYKKAIMIPHGHMLDYVEIASLKESREKLGIPQNRTVFLFFGQIKKVKGVDLLLKAVLELKGKRDDFFVVIAGSVWKADFSSCENIISNNDLSAVLKTEIRYIPDDEVKLYYSSTDVCVLPYTDVYQSGVIQLAYGYKKPVISSDLPAFTQFVTPNKTGYLFNNGNYHELAAMMEKAIDNKEKLPEYGLSGYNLVRRKLDWNVLAKEIYKKCYEQ